MSRREAFAVFTLAVQVPGWLQAVLVVLFLVVCLFLILTVLIQRPTGGGLVGAFGSGAGSGQTAFGTKTGDALTIVTIGMFVLYLLFGVGLNYALRPAKAAPAQQQTAPASETAPKTDTPKTDTPQGDAPKAADAPVGEAPKTAEPAAAPVEAPK